MANKELKLILKVDSKSGETAIKSIATQLKGLEKVSLSKGLAEGTSTASKNMKKLKESAAKAAEEYRKIADVSRADAERLQKRIKLEKQQMAVINRAHGEAIRMERKRAAAIDRVNKKTEKQIGIISRVKKNLFALRSYWLAISAAVAIVGITIVKAFKAGFSSVERFRLSVASVAASITTFSDLSAGNVAEVYNNAYKYAEKLALKMEIINAKTIATGEQLRAMNETFIQQGVLLDINSKKQEEAFVSIANAISLITQGQNQEIQMRQEVRGLLSGDIRATNLLARMINAKLGGTLKENIILWKQQGTLLENLGSHLEGFKAGSADLASTWAALSTTFETIANRYLRNIFKPVYEDIIKTSLDFSRTLLDQKNALGDTGKILKDELLTAWKSIKNTAEGVWNTVDALKEPLLAMLALVNQIVHGWSLIFKHVTDTVLTLKDKTLTKEGVMTWLEPLLKSIGYEGDFTLSSDFKTKADLGDKDKVDKPILSGGGPSEAGLKRAKAWFTEWERMEKENQKNLIKIKHEGFQQAVSLLMLEKQAIIDKYGEQEAIHEHFRIKYNMLAKEESERKKEAIDKELELRAENQEKILSYISTESENKKRAIVQEAERLANLTDGWEEHYAIREAAQIRLDELEVKETKERIKAAEKRAELLEKQTEKAAAEHEKVLQYISTEEENTLRAIENERLALLGLATTEAERKEINAVANREKHETTISDLQKWAESAKSAGEIATEAAISAADSFSSGFTNAFFEFAEGTKSAGEAFKDFAASFLKQVARMILQALILKAIQAGIGAVGGAGGAGGTVSNTGQGLGGGAGVDYAVNMPAAQGAVVSNGNKMMEYAKGAAFNNGMKMHAFATGGIVNSPTVFPMKNGMGLMGEAGPEAIMPLKRGKDGKLGIEGGGGNTINTTINVTNNGGNEESEDTTRRSRELANVIKIEFNKNLMEQMRPGGALNMA